MFGFGKKAEKRRGMGGLLSLIGGILVVVSFFMALTSKATVGDLPALSTSKFTSSMSKIEGENKKTELIPKITLFSLAKENKLLYIIPALGLLGVLIGSYLFKLALLNIVVGCACFYLGFLIKPVSLLGIDFLFRHPGMGMMSLSLGGFLLISGGFFTAKKNFSSKKKKKTKPEKKKKKK